jgi:hypothetical protein
MSVFQKRRGANGSVEFFIDGNKVDVNAFVDSSGGKENIFTALRDSKDVNQLDFLKQSLAQHSNTQGAIAEIDRDIQNLNSIQQAKTREDEVFRVLGFDANDIAGMSPEEKRMWQFQGYEKLKQIEESKPIIDPLSPAAIQKMKEQISNDPGIKKYERDTINKFVEDTTERVRQMQLQGDQFTDQFNLQAEQTREAMAENSQAKGQLFSPVRQGEVQQLQEQEQGIIASFAESQKQQLQAIGRSLEGAIGTDKTLGEFGNILTLNNTLTGNQVNYAPSAVQKQYNDSSLGRDVGQLQQNQLNIETDRIERLAGIK